MFYLFVPLYNIKILINRIYQKYLLYLAIFLFDSFMRCLVSSIKVNCIILLNEKWNLSLAAKKLTVAGRHFSRNSYTIWKIEAGHIEMSVYMTSVDPQKHRCDPPRCRTTRMLIRLAPPGDSVHPERRRSPLRDVDVTPVVREESV